MQIDARAGEDLRLAIQREVVRVLRHQDMRQQPFCRQGALDQAGGRRCLGDPFLAGPAGILRPHGDDHPKLRGNDVEPLGAVFADANHLAATARAECALGLDYFLDPRQVGRQMTRCCAVRPGAWDVAPAPCSPGPLPRPRRARLRAPRRQAGTGRDGASRTSARATPGAARSTDVRDGGCDRSAPRPRREAPQEPLAVLRTTPARAVQAILDRPCLCSSP